MTKETFKLVRKSTGLNQAKFAEELGYGSFRAVLRKESGDTGISRQDEIIIELKFPYALGMVEAELQKAKQ